MEGHCGSHPSRPGLVRREDSGRDFAECALTLPDAKTGTAGPADVAPHLAFLAKLVARDSNLGRAHLLRSITTPCSNKRASCSGSSISMVSPVARTRALILRSMVSTSTIQARYRKVVSAVSTSSCTSISCTARFTGSCTTTNCVRAIPILNAFSGYRSLDAAKKAERLTEIAAGLPAVGILPTANKFAQTLTNAVCASVPRSADSAERATDILAGGWVTGSATTTSRGCLKRRW